MAPPARDRSTLVALLRHLGFAGAALFCACSPAPHGAAVRRDSAGVALVESRATAWRQGQGWSVDSAAAVVLDSVPSWAADELGVAALADGSLAVAGERGRITWYDRSGRKTASAEIPGFDATAALLPTGRGGLIAWDPERRTAVPVSADGRTGPPRAVRGPLPRGSVAPVGAFADGSVLVTVRDAALFRISPLPAHDTVPLFRVGPGAAARLLDVTGPEELTWGSDDGAVRIPVPFPRNTYVAVAGARVWVADARTGDIRAYDRQGRLLEIVRAPFRGDPVDPAEISRWRVRLRRLAHGQVPDAEVGTLESALSFPSTYAPFTALLAAPGGELWLRAGSAEDHDARWNVLSADGAWLGVVRVPRSFDVVAAGTRYLVAKVAAPGGNHLVILPLRR